ncbi:MAG: HU family DNA-binding protein [Streptococcus sp.]|nr:HU family DNA-binding protein [Streptococcus sp.]
MSTPVQPLDFTVAYNADYYCCVLTVTPGDSTHTGFHFYSRATSGDAWQLRFSDNSPAYFGSEADAALQWQVTAYNNDGESIPFVLTSNPPGPTAATGLTAIRRNDDPNTVDVAWSGTLIDSEQWVISVSDNGGYSFDLPTQQTTSNSAVVTLDRWKTGAVKVHPGNHTELAVQSNSITMSVPATLAAPTIALVNVSSLDRIETTFTQVDWEGAPEFQYYFTFTKGVDSITLVRTAAVLSTATPGERQLWTETPAITHANAAEWTVTVSGGYRDAGWNLIHGETSTPIALTPEGASTLLSFDMAATGQIYWVFSDWQNAVPLDVETRIDNGAWVPTLITDHTRSNEELYGDQCVVNAEGVGIGGNWDGGILGKVDWYEHFDGQIHSVQSRARIHGSTDLWIESTPRNLQLESALWPELLWSERSVVGQNGPVLIPLPSIGIRRPVTVDSYQLSFAVDSGSFIPVRIGHLSLNDPFIPYTDYRSTEYIYHLVDALPVVKKDGNQHSFVLKLTLIKDENPIHDYLFPAHLATIPTRVNLMPIAPSNIVPAFKKVRDPFTNQQTGCEFTARLTYDAAMLKAAVSVDDGAFSDVTWTGISAYPPTVKFNGVVVPRDGLSHIVKFKVWHHDSNANEDSTELLGDSLLATFDMAPPADPTAVTATLIRDGVDEFPDQVRVEWTSDDPVDIFLIDPDAKKRKLYSADAQESAVVLENARKYGPQNGQPHEYRFGVAAFNRSNYSTTIYAAPLIITSGAPAVAALTPDDIAGTAEKLSQAQLITALDTQLTTVDAAVIAQVLTAAVQKIKDVVSKGGSVTLDNIGQFAADWTLEKTAFRNGQYVTVPAQRNAVFNASLGLTKGTRAGLVLSDIEAANLA